MDPQLLTTYEPLHKRGSKGEIRVWFMERGVWEDGNSGHRVVSGILDGTMTRSGWNMATPKNVGKKNATTAVSQALSEVENEYAIKRERGYFDDVNKVDEVPFTKPMLAQDWDKRKAKVDIFGGVYAQPKLDGMRCIARADGLWTRTGKPIVSCPHIVESLEAFFEGNPDCELDGELYNHTYKDRFNDLMSILRKEKPSDEDVAEARNVVEYHIYDLVDPVRSFAGRQGSLGWTFENYFAGISCLQPVETSHVRGQDALDALYARWIEEGYEGQMIRLDAPYENKRSNNLMKRKDFVSEEFAVVAMEEGKGNWAGCVKRFVVRLPDETTNDATPRGTQEKLRALLESGDVPDWATVRYFGVTPDGKLRFPIATDWGKGKRDD
jgi:DNA ligase 1